MAHILRASAVAIDKLDENLVNDAEVEEVEEQGIEEGNRDEQQNSDDQEQTENVEVVEAASEKIQETEPVAHGKAESLTNDDSDADSEQTCPICMDHWTCSGEHRLCCLRCGHLFGHSCILKWLQTSCNSTNRRCPQCNKKAAVKHIRMLYAKRLTSVDTTELDALKGELASVSSEKSRIEIELSRHVLRQKLYEQQLSGMKKRVIELESQRQVESRAATPQNLARHSSKKFHLDRSLELCKEGGCRVLDYNPWYGFLVVSQKSNNTLFSGYGVKKIDSEGFQPRQFIFLHSQAIRDLSFNAAQQSLLLSVGFDKSAKMLDIRNNLVVHSYQSERALWSCCWSGDNPHVFFVGGQNGSIAQFDTRQTSGAVETLESPGDRSPVVSLASVPTDPAGGIARGGFIACRLNTCYAYEQKDSKYVQKQIFLEGPFVSVCYDRKNNHALISTRPNVRQPHARHVVCTLEKSSDESTVCNVVHTFHAGNSQKLLSRPCHVNVENDTLVAAHQESISSISLWSIVSGKQVCALPVSDPVVDLCAIDVKDTLFLATLSAKKIRFYSYG